MLNEPSASHKNAFMLNCCSRLALLSMFHLLLGHSRKAHSHWMKTKNMCTIAFNVGTCYTSSSSPIEPFPMLVFSFFFFILWHRFNGGVCLIGNFELFSPFFFLLRLILFPWWRLQTRRPLNIKTVFCGRTYFCIMRAWF